VGTYAAPSVVGQGQVKAPKPAVLWAIALAAVVGATGSVLLLVANDAPNVQVVLMQWISVPYVLAGLVAWWRRPDSRLGVLMIAGGFAIGLSALQVSDADVLYTIGAWFDLVPAAIFLCVYLSFPTGRLSSRFERALVAACFAAAVGLQLAKIAIGATGSDNLLQLVSWPEASLRLEQVQVLAISAICLIGFGVLAVRRLQLGRLRRRSLGLLVDSFALALVMIAALLIDNVFQQPAYEPLYRASFLVIGLSPIVFLIALLDARLARSAVGELVIELRSDPAPADLQAAVSRALRDPSLTLAYWLPDFETYADLDGRPVEVPARDGRAATPIDRNGVRIAALLHDPELEEEPELLDAVGATAAIALENARLQAELAARLEEVRASRARVIEAGQKERQRLERNLHDGAQQRLIALSLNLKLLQKQLGDNPEASRQLDEAQREITMSLEDLRDVAHGIHPAVLTAHGLAVALEQVAARAPVSTRLDVEIEARLPEPVEVAAYYVVTESLANVGKHAQATSASVDVRRTAEGLVVEVVDDGIGGADSERGTGLRGLADRVEALGGRLRVWTSPGGGTRVRAEIPCA
jgi:signal transduction histidine kinase